MLRPRNRETGALVVGVNCEACCMLRLPFFAVRQSMERGMGWYVSMLTAIAKILLTGLDAEFREKVR